MRSSLLLAAAVVLLANNGACRAWSPVLYQQHVLKSPRVAQLMMRYGDGGSRYDGRGRGGRGGRYSGRGGGDGGNGGSGYTRDPNDRSEVDVARVEALISERTDLRINRQYNDADAVRNELAQMGVQLWDRDRVWSCSTTPPPRSRSERTEDLGNNFYRKAQRFAAREVSGGGGYARGAGRSGYGRGSLYIDGEAQRSGSGARIGYDARPRAKPKERKFNEHGHDYSRSGDDRTELAEAAVEAINTMLRERMEAKFARNFDEADALLQRLHEKYGVSVNDGSKAWRADGQSFQRQFKRVGPAIPAPGGGEEDEAKVEAQVLALIAERMAARKDRNYRYADQILADLLQMYGVVLVDADYTYRYVGDGHDGGYGEGGGYGRRADVDASQGHDYMREVGCDAELSAEALSEINDLLAKRLARKKAREFDKADALQEVLWQRGVGVDDKARTWWVE